MPVAEKPQVLQALERATENRLARAALKREIKAGAVSVAELLRCECRPCLQTMYVEDFIGLIPRMPRKRVHRLMRAVPVAFIATVGKLTGRQRLALADALDAMGGKRS